MADYVVVDREQLEVNLTVVADAIRAKGGTAKQLEFPNGMVDAVMEISTGSDLSATEIYVADYSISDDIQMTAGVVDIWRRCLVS